MANIYTVQITTAKQLRLTEKPGYLDVSTKGGDKVFAPTWPMTIAYMNDDLSDDDYKDQYYELMRKSYRENRADWDRVLAMDEVYLGCYCSVAKFCHRHLLAEMFVRCGAVLKEEKRFPRRTMDLYPGRDRKYHGWRR